MGLVAELRTEALDQNVSVASLLRKALVVATKLDLQDSVAWVNQELGGYQAAGENDFPAYRILHGRIESFNPYYGWTPVVFRGKGNSMDTYGKCHVFQSAPEIEQVVRGVEGREGILEVPFSQEAESNLFGAMDSPRQIRRRVTYAQVSGIVEAVRTTILRWALKLESEGILGEGMTFAAEDRRKTETGNHNIQVFIGNTSAGNIQQGDGAKVEIHELSPEMMEKIAAWIGQLRSDLNKIEMAATEKQEAQAEIKTVESQLNSPKPKITIVQEGLLSLRRILENAAGSAIATALMGQYPVPM